jgi:hypothetical protein
MPQWLILVSASQGNPILWPIQHFHTKKYAMNELTGAKVLIGELLLYNAVKDIYFTSEIKFRKLNN